jgi:hypothetical protein
MQCIKDYPNNIKLISVAIDSIVNALDDLLDEELDASEKATYICILIENISYLISNIDDKKMSKEITKYFAKILEIAIGEQIYRKKIILSKSEKKLFRNILEQYKIRSQDIDIYFLLPLISKNYSPYKIKNILEQCRIFRIYNLFLKDLKDLKHDLKAGIFTPVTYLYQKNKSQLMNFYMYLKHETSPLINKIQKHDDITNNIISLIEKEDKNISIFLKNLL